jgi:hypothetical protein
LGTFLQQIGEYDYMGGLHCRGRKTLHLQRIYLLESDGQQEGTFSAFTPKCFLFTEGIQETF